MKDGIGSRDGPRGKSWYFVADLGIGPDGKRKQLHRRGFASRKEAAAARAHALSDLRQGSYTEPSKERLDTYLARWLTATAGRRRPATNYAHARILERLPDWLLATPLSRLTPLAIQQAEGELGRRLSPNTVRITHVVLKSALHQAVRWRELPRNPVDGVDPPARRQRPVVVWTVEEQARFLAAVEGIRSPGEISTRIAGIPHGDAKSNPGKSNQHAALFRLLLDTGMRIGEALALRWADCDLMRANETPAPTSTSGVSAAESWSPTPRSTALSAHCTTHVPTVRIERTTTRDVTGKQVLGEHPKTSRSRRTLSVELTTAAALLSYRKEQLQRRLLAGQDWQDMDLIFDGGSGGLCPASRFDYHLRKAAAAAGVPVLSMHGLRKTMTVTWLRAGVSPKVVSDRLGHHSAALSLDVYSSVSGDWQAEGVEQVSAFKARVNRGS